MAYQRLAPPVLGDMTEHPVLNLVPFAGAGREVGHRDTQPERIRQLLQLEFPPSAAAAVGTTAVSGDQQTLGVRIGVASHLPPPAADRLHGKLCRVVVDTDTHPAGISGQVVDAVGDCLAEFAVDEVVDFHLLGPAFRTPLPTAIAIRADRKRSNHDVLSMRMNRLLNGVFLPRGTHSEPNIES